MTTRTTRTAALGGDGLIVRFLVLVMAVVAAALVAFAVDTVWALVGAVAVLLALLFELLVVLSHYLSAADESEAVPDSPAAVVASEAAAAPTVVQAPRPPRGTRLLVLAGEAASSIDQVPPSVRALIAGAENVFVIAPALPTRLEWLLSDVDRARAEATSRLEVALRQLHDVDIAAAGAVGDDTPLTAVGDGVWQFDPDHVVVALRDADHADWQEQGLTDAIEHRFRVPLTAFAIADGDRR
jgi:hypothetical protein